MRGRGAEFNSEFGFNKNPNQSLADVGTQGDNLCQYEERRLSIILPTTKLVEEILNEAQYLDEEKLWQALESPKLYVGLDHWQLWLLLCLSKHVARQEWVGMVVETRLRGELEKIGELGDFGHPEDIEDWGKVPEFPEWRYNTGPCRT